MGSQALPEETLRDEEEEGPRDVYNECNEIDTGSRASGQNNCHVFALLQP